MMRIHIAFAALVLGSGGLVGQTIAPAGAPTPNLESNIERPLRYRPDGHDFVIENGGEFFNRPLYGRNTAFRVDAGDVPEFLLYLPGRGGNLRLGIRTAEGATWLHAAASITARYRPGQMLYEVRDPLLGATGVLHVAAVPMHETDGLIVRLEGRGLPEGCEVLYAFGGVNGRRGRRDGDIGTEDVPISHYFQLRPDVCADNRIELSAARFVLRAKPATIVGLLPEDATVAVGAAAQWSDPKQLAKSTGDGVADPVAFGTIPLASGAPRFLALQRVNEARPATDAEELAVYRDVTAPTPSAAPRPAVPLRSEYVQAEIPALFDAAEAYYTQLRTQIAVRTPDPYIDAAVAALNVAADAVWDEPQQGIMHGAIAWRSRLLGWRGPYAMDALGWHERTRAHLRYWASRQNTGPIPDTLPPPDEDANLARSEAALHSNGDMSNSHYDMNLVAIDAFFRHLRWTGDIEFAREFWPVLERHLAWERRLFRREFTTTQGETLPLYEAYAAIWASDDLQYHGGGTAHASAYNAFHLREAARLADLLGHDGSAYANEADAIERGMRELLWVPETGAYAEFKDLLGLQGVHPSAALWSVYHVIDSEIGSPSEQLALTRYVEQHLPRLPVRGAGLPPGDHHVYASTNWMPYTWSINNVVMGENVHTALAFWQAGRPEEAFRLTRSALLASMFMGICPGNVGSMNYLDVYRRESQRDFADGSGVLARALVEGLFGLRPDAVGGRLRIAPGFPAAWDQAELTRPGVHVAFSRAGRRETLRIKTRLWDLDRIEVELPSHGRKREHLRIAKDVEAGELIAEVVWSGDARPAELAAAAPIPQSAALRRATSGVTGELHAIDLAPHFNDRVTEIFRRGKYRSPRSPYVSLALPAQGIGAWAGHVNAFAEIDDSGLRAASAAQGGLVSLPSGLRFVTPGPGSESNVLFVSQWDNYPNEASLPAQGRARRLHLLMAGSTYAMQSRFDNGEVVVTYVDGSTARLALRNPETWWPIEQDYFIDDYQFRVDAPLPVRVDLKTGAIRVLDHATFKGQGRAVPGGAATVLALDLDASRELKSITVRALANEVVIGLMAATLER